MLYYCQYITIVTANQVSNSTPMKAAALTDTAKPLPSDKLYTVILQQ